MSNTFLLPDLGEGLTEADIVRWLVAEGGFPEALALSFRGPVNAIVEWMRLNLFVLTDGLKTVATLALINPLEAFLVGMPWWGTTIVVAGATSGQTMRVILRHSLAPSISAASTAARSCRPACS